MSRKLVSLLLVLAMLLSLGTAAVAESGTTLKVALTNPFTGACAINIANPYRYATLSQVYESLLCYDGGEYVGVLAKEWEKLNDYTWKVVLFDGITDSQGNPFTSEDVAWALNGQKEAGHNLSAYYEADCVKVVDPTTFELTLSTDSDGAFYLIGAQVMLCTQEAYDASSDHLATMPVGTGPYACSAYLEGSSATLTKRADYWKTENLPKSSVANFDTIEISYVPEAVQMSVAIESGNVQLAGQVNMSIAPDVDALADVAKKYCSNGTYNGLGFNMNGREVSTNKALREAICYAIDPEGLIMGIYAGHATKMNTYGMATASDFDPSWTAAISYDPDKAREKLAEAGFPNGTSIVMLANNVGEDSLFAELVQGYLAEVGIECTLDYVDPATQNAKRAEGNWDINPVGGIGVLDMSLFWGNLYAKQETGMSQYFHNDPALYEIYEPYMLAGGKTAENLQKLYEYELANTTWFPLFNKEVLFAISGGYTDLFVNDVYMALPFLGTVTK